MKRWWIFLQERFPLHTHIPIIGSFTFSAICFSYLASNRVGYISLLNFFLAFSLTLSLFFLLRLSDEIKDFEDDKLYRRYLPLPRGLLTTKQLKQVAVVIIILQITLVVVFPYFLWAYLSALGFLALMHNEFFVKNWLKKRQWLYVITHMAIIPIIDIVASSAHWGASKIEPPKLLLMFFIISLFNGIILEIGRKIKTKQEEEIGVVSYTSLLGEKKAPMVWFFILLVTFLLTCLASIQIESSWHVLVFLTLMFVLSGYWGLQFLRSPTTKNSELIEKASGIWTIAMYFGLGILPYFIQLWS